MLLANTSNLDQQYAISFEEIAPGIVSWANTAAAVGETLIQSIARIRTQVQMSEQQRMLIDLQLQRAQLGLPPAGYQQNTGVSGTTLLLVAVVVFLLAKGRK